MKLMNFVLWILISSIGTSSALLVVPEDEFSRIKRSRTTVCVEVRPTRSHHEPYYMCKGGDMPADQPTSTLRPYSSEKSSPLYKPRTMSSFDRDLDVSTPATMGGYHVQSQLEQQPFHYYRPDNINDFNLQRTYQQSSLAFPGPNQQIWSYVRASQPPIQTRPVLQPTLQPEQAERTVGFHTENSAYFPRAEKPFQTFQTQYRYQPEQSNEFQSNERMGHYAQEKTPNSFTPRYSNGYRATSQGSAYPNQYRSNFFSEPGQGSNHRYNSASENDNSNTNEQYSSTFPTGLGQLVQMDRSSNEPFTGVARPNAFQKGFDSDGSNIPDQDLLFGDVENPSLPNEFITHQQPVTPINLIVDVSPQDLRTLFNPPTIPDEFMNDPVLRTFYSSLLDQNPVATNLPSLLKQNENENVINENSGVKKSSCSSCANNDNENFGVEKVAARAPCPTKDFNWPPVVIAMPCCGQQSNTPAPPLPTPGYYNPYSLPLLGMYPSFMPTFNPTGMDNSNYAQAFQHQYYQNTPQASAMATQGRAANNDNSAHEESNFKKTTTEAEAVIEVVDMTDAPIKTTEATTENNAPEVKSETQSLVDKLSEDSNTTTTTPEPTFAEETAEEETTDAADTLKLKDDPPKTFQTMLNRAKTFKELSVEGRNLEQINNNSKKGKRQNFKDANTALRTIAEVVAASNKRKYSTVIH